MNPARVWLHAIRPRTLMLAVATTSLGTALAYHYGAFRPSVFALTIVTATLLQVISNLANDLGDFLKGADSIRVGQLRTVQAGWISKQAMMRALVVTVTCACISGCWLLWAALGREIFVASLVYIALGAASVGAALAYTLGARPFGYDGLGDVAVFFFFGIVGVCGTCFLQTHAFEWSSLLPAAAMGALSTGVLNINNMRDIETDKIAGKHTVAVRLGSRSVRVYHSLLVVIAFGATWTFVFLERLPIAASSLVLIVTMALFGVLTARIVTTRVPARLEPYLKIHSLLTLIYALGLGALLCLH